MIAENQSSVLDLEFISSIRSLDQPGEEGVFLKELIDMFTKITPPLIQGLVTAMHNEDFKAAQNIAHRLKGGSSNVGAVSLSGICSTIEKMAAKKSLVNHSDFSAKLEQEFTTAVHQLNEQALLR